MRRKPLSDVIDDAARRFDSLPLYRASLDAIRELGEPNTFASGGDGSNGKPVKEWP